MTPKEKRNITENLPIYKCTVRYVHTLLEYSKNYNRDFKRTLCDSMCRNALELPLLLQKINVEIDTSKKWGYISDFIAKFGAIRFMTQESCELKCISRGQLGVLSLMEEEIGRQATGWKHHIESLLLKKEEEGLLGAIEEP
jgi:hypothetical protein